MNDDLQYNVQIADVNNQLQLSMSLRFGLSVLKLT